MTNTTKLTHTVTETAAILGIGRTAAYEAVRTGQIPAIRIGKRLLVSKSTVEKLLEGGHSPVEPESR